MCAMIWHSSLKSMSQAKLDTPCNVSLLDLLPSNCTSRNCPFICEGHGICRDGNRSKAGRLHQIRSTPNWDRDWALVAQEKRLSALIQHVA